MELVTFADCSTLIRSLQQQIFSTPTLPRVVAVDGSCVSVAVCVSGSSASLETLQRVVESIRYGQLGLLAGGEVGGGVQDVAGQPGLVRQVASTVSHSCHIVGVRDN